MTPPDQVNVRHMNVHEAGNVAGLFHRIWHETQAELQHPSIAAERDLDFFVSRVTAYDRPPIVAGSGAELVGLAVWKPRSPNHPVAGRGYIAALYVSGEARSRGVGQRLLDATEREMAEFGLTSGFLGCLEGNDAALRFYERNGWVNSGLSTEHLDADEKVVRFRYHHMIKELDGVNDGTP